jgi:hypothetical protein
VIGRISFGCGVDRRGGRQRILGRIGAIGLGLALALTTGLLLAARAEAATISTYTFTQGGYTYSDGSPSTAILNGTFAGSVEPDGLMKLAGLTRFEMRMTIDPGTPGEYVVPSSDTALLFSFDTLSSPNALGGNSSLALVSFGFFGFPASLCVGSPTPFSCHVSANGAFTFYGLKTLALPHVTLVTAATPIPAPLLLFGTALAGFGLLGTTARRRLRAA